MEKEEVENKEIKKKSISKLQYSLTLLLGFLFLGINAYLVYGLYNNEVEFDVSCPLPLGQVESCECKYGVLNALTARKPLEFCYCYPHGSNISLMPDQVFGMNLSKYSLNLTIIN